jgi:hypothetical protein
MGVSWNGGTSKMDGLFHGKSIYKWMIWGYPYFRKPPYVMTIGHKTFECLASTQYFSCGVSEFREF